MTFPGRLEEFPEGLVGDATGLVELREGEEAWMVFFCLRGRWEARLLRGVHRKKAHTVAGATGATLRGALELLIEGLGDE